MKMNKKRFKAVGEVVVCGVLQMVIGLCIVYALVHPEPEPVQDRIPFTWEIQQQLRSAGYDIGDSGADGKIGQNTVRAWKQYEDDVTGQWADHMTTEAVKKQENEV